MRTVVASLVVCLALLTTGIGAAASGAAGPLASLQPHATTIGPGRPGMRFAQAVRVRAVDTAGRGLPGVTVRWAGDVSGGWVFPQTAVTDADGWVTGRWMGGSPGSGTLTASANHLGVAASATVATTTVNPPSPPLSALGVTMLNPGSATGYLIDITPHADPQGTFIAAMLWFGGYAGLQRNGSLYTNQLQFSIWDQPAGQAHLVSPGAGLSCVRYTNEGSGLACSLDFQWEVEETYRFLLEIAPVSGGRHMTLTVRRLSTDVSTVVGTLFQAGTDALGYLGTFVEQFHIVAPHCLDQPLRSYSFRGVQARLDTGWSPLLSGGVGRHDPEATCGNVDAVVGPDGVRVTTGRRTMSDPATPSPIAVPAGTHSGWTGIRERLDDPLPATNRLVTDLEIVSDGPGNVMAGWVQGSGTVARHHAWLSSRSRATGLWGNTDGDPSRVSLESTAQSVAVGTNPSGSAAAVAWGEVPSGQSEWVIKSSWHSPLTQPTTATLFVSQSGPRALFPSVATSEAGTGLAVWVSGDFLSNTTIKASRRDSISSPWRVPVDISLGGDLAYWPRVQFDGNGNGVAVWLRRQAGQFNLESAHFAASTGFWSSPQRADSGPFSGRVWLVADRNGVATALVTRSVSGGDRVEAVRFDPKSGFWNSGSVLSPPGDIADTGMDLAVDGLGNVTAVWVRDGVLEVARSTPEFGSWGPRRVLATGVSAPRVAVDPAGNTVVVWTRLSGSTSLVYARRYWADTGLWESTSFGVGIGVSPRVAIDADSSATVAWSLPDRSGIQATRYERVPAAPTILSTTSAGGSVSVHFLPGANIGIAARDYEYSIDGGSTWWSRRSPSTDSPLVIPGLTGGATYNIAVRELNRVGAGLSSNVVSVVVASTTMTATPVALAFTVVRGTAGGVVTSVTPAQLLKIDSHAGSPAWTLRSSDMWLATSNTGGVGAGSITVSLAHLETFATGPLLRQGTLVLTSPGMTNSPLTIPVTVTVRESADTTAAPVGVFDTPMHNATVSGSLAVTGWALDDVGIDRVEIWRDRITADPAPPFEQIGHPAHGKVFIARGTFVEGTRPDVEAIYTTTPARHRAGWGYLLLTQGFPNANGTFVLTAIAWDKEGRSTVLGTKTIIVNNATATKPFGSIDVPAYGATFSGHEYTYGWALTPNAGCTMSGGQVYMTIDSAPPNFPVTYGANRTDIAAAFPGLQDSNGAGGAVALNSLNYSNGTHQIGWLVYDSCGNGEGIGSRFFTILNSGARAAGRAEARPLGSPEPSAPRDLISGAGPAFGRATMPDVPVSSDVLWLVRGMGTLETPLSASEQVRLSQTGRIEVHVTRPGVAPMEGLRYEGYLVVNGELRALPIGSSFDARRGSFFWQPVAGFLGAYDVRILQLRGDTPEVMWTVRVEVGAEGER